MRWQSMATSSLSVFPATRRNRARSSLACGTDMGYLRQPGSPCPPLYSQMGVRTPSSVPTSLRTTRDSYSHVLKRRPNRKRKTKVLVRIYLLCRTDLRRLQASEGGGIPQGSAPPIGGLLGATAAGV